MHFYLFCFLKNVATRMFEITYVACFCPPLLDSTATETRKYFKQATGLVHSNWLPHILGLPISLPKAMSSGS